MAASRSPKKRVTRPRANSGRGGRGSVSLAALSAESLALQRQERELRALANQFHESDLPAFDAWMDACFAQERQEATRLHEKADELEDILDEADLAYESGEFGSLSAALAAEMERDKGDDFPADLESDADSAAPIPDEIADFLFAQFMAEARGINAARMDPAAYAKAKADFMASFEKAQAGDRLGFEKSLLKTGADDSDENVREVKALYRRVAKRLHPDASGSWEEGEKRLWDEASKAYEALDLGGLQRIDLILTLERSEEIPASRNRELRRLHNELRDLVANLTSELTELRAHPGWEFGKRKRTKSFRERIQSDLDEAIYSGRMRIKMLEMRIRAILGPKRKAKSKPKARGRTRPAEEQTEIPF